MSASKPDSDDEISSAAAAWTAKRSRGLTAPEQDEFFAWLAADPLHGEWLARHQQTENALKNLVQWRPEHGGQPNPDLLAHHRKAGRSRWLVAALGVGMAIAASVAMMMWSGSRADRPSIEVVPTPPVSETARVEQLHRVLDDGSTIDLNRGAEVTVRFTAAERLVQLTKGEAHFTVAKNPAWPFVVQANQVSVRAVGTAFDVQLEPAAVAVLVTDGHVRLDRAEPGPVSREKRESGAGTILAVGQKAVVNLEGPDRQPKISAARPDEVERVLAWEPRTLEFSDAPLSVVVAAFNRDDRVKIVIEDPALASLSIGATLRSDNVEGFIRLLKTSFRVEVRRGATDEIILRRTVTAVPHGG